MDGDTNRLIKKQDLIHLAILLAVALGIGIYLIATSVLIARDGVTYIEFAKKIAASPIKTMRDVALPPGYSVLICITNKLIGLFYSETSLESWIISAQCVSLVCKIIATVILYLLGSMLVGARMSFWAVLILTFLPDSAAYGSDALTDWSYIMFLVTGFWLLLLGAGYSKWWIFGLAGIITGFGYLIRPECCQLVVYGGGWLLFNLIRPQDKMSRAVAVGALILLLAGFAVIATPYMRLTGYIIPEHRIGTFPPFIGMVGSNIDGANVLGGCLAGVAPVEMAKGFWNLLNNICENLMYFFVPAWLIGIYCQFRRKGKETAPVFFIACFILLNIFILMYHHSATGGIMSRRYVLPLLAVTIFYIPVGLQAIGQWLQNMFFTNTSRMGIIMGKSEFWFFTLLITGISICLPKLLRPMRIEKQAYKEAANWLRENTAPVDIIAVPDTRVAFYAERKGRKYTQKVPEGTNYAVKIYKDEDELVAEKELLGAKKAFSFTYRNTGAITAIYDIRGYISEKVYFVEYHCEKIADERYKFSLVFDVNNGFEKDLLIYLLGYVKDEHIILLPENRQKHKFNNWGLWPKPATSSWPKNDRVTITHEISAKPIPYNLRLGFWIAKEGNHGRRIDLGWVDLGDIKKKDGKKHEN